MAEFEIKTLKLEEILDQSLMVGGNVLHQKVLENVPRTNENLPNEIKLKIKKKPERNIRKNNKHFYRKPVIINGKWFEGTTGNLKRSIGMEKIGMGEYIVGVHSGPTEDYAAAQEFGTSKIPSRSYLRKSLKENKKEIISHIADTFKKLSDKN